jgi:hypothetical protein
MTFDKVYFLKKRINLMLFKFSMNKFMKSKPKLNENYMIVNGRAAFLLFGTTVTDRSGIFECIDRFTFRVLSLLFKHFRLLKDNNIPKDDI